MLSARSDYYLAWLTLIAHTTPPTCSKLNALTQLSIFNRTLLHMLSIEPSCTHCIRYQEGKVQGNIRPQRDTEPCHCIQRVVYLGKGNIRLIMLHKGRKEDEGGRGERASEIYIYIERERDKGGLRGERGTRIFLSLQRDASDSHNTSITRPSALFLLAFHRQSFIWGRSTAGYQQGANCQVSSRALLDCQQRYIGCTILLYSHGPRMLDICFIVYCWKQKRDNWQQNAVFIVHVLNV